MFRIFTWCALCLLLPLAAVAQTYPDYDTPYINDFAGLITDADLRATLHDQLVQLRQDSGIEMTVVTLPSQDPYAPDATLEAFATGLFNHWGVGNAQRNDGIMVLVLPEDRAMRIELGAGYARDWDDIARQIVDRSFLPFFRDDNYQAGILAGSTAVIEQIAVPFSAGSRPKATSGDPAIWPLLVIIGTLMLFFAPWAWFGDLFMRRRTCPQCGAKGTLRVTRHTLYHATADTPGRQERIVTCTQCNYRDVTTIRLPRKRAAFSKSSGGFGGGRSGGGGASGRW
ncbi:MAG: TPM domain-containing protein [Pseudomonadota bacterium]